MSVEITLRDAEHDIELKSHHLSRLYSEFNQNVNTLKNSFYPRTQPLIAAVYMSREDQKHVEMQIKWLEMKVLAMEQSKGFLELRDMAAPKKQAFDALQRVFEDAFTSLEKVTKDELGVLRGYEHPPQIVLDVIEVVMLLRGESDISWTSSKVMLSETYYYSFFISKVRSRHRQEVDEKVMNKLELFLATPESAAENVLTVSRPVGAMAKWLRALRDYYRLQKITAPKKQTSDEAKEELLDLRKKLQQKKGEILGAEERLQQLQLELDTKLGELRLQYDATMTPLQEKFFEANKHFNDVFCSPLRHREDEERNS